MNILDAYWEEEEVETEEQSDNIPEEFYEAFLENLGIIAKHYLGKFFADKKMYFGGSISPIILYSPIFISTVINTEITAALDRAYKSIENSFLEHENKGVTNHIVFVLSFMDECVRKRIPPPLKGGMLLIYLQLCKGVILVG